LPRGTATTVPVTVALEPPSEKVSLNVHLMAFAGTGAFFTSLNGTGVPPAGVKVPVMEYGMSSSCVPAMKAGVNEPFPGGVVTSVEPIGAWQDT